MGSDTYNIKDIGNTLQLREEIDPGLKVSHWFKQGLNIVDIQPAHFKLDLSTDEIQFGVYNTGEDSTLGYTDPTKKFQSRCRAYGLAENATALRLWITGESTFQEELGTEYETNLIESGINGLVSKISPMLNTVKSIAGAAGSKATSNVARGAISPAIDNFADSASSMLGGGNTVKTASKVLKKFSHLITNRVFGYNYLSIPKTYSGTSYAPSLGFNVRLVSPYGARVAVQEFIINPLTYLLLLSSPTTLDGLTYGGASYVTVKAYGIADLPLAIIDNISIRRGGNDVAYNKYRQPLSIDINISIKPASDGFAAYMSGGAEGDRLNIHEVNQDGVVGIATSTSNENLGSVDISEMGKRGSSMTTVGDILESFKPMPIYDQAQGDILKGETVLNFAEASVRNLARVVATSMVDPFDGKVIQRESAFSMAQKQSPPSFAKAKPVSHFETKLERAKHGGNIIDNILSIF